MAAVISNISDINAIITPIAGGNQVSSADISNITIVSTSDDFFNALDTTERGAYAVIPTQGLIGVNAFIGISFADGFLGGGSPAATQNILGSFDKRADGDWDVAVVDQSNGESSATVIVADSIVLDGNLCLSVSVNTPTSVTINVYAGTIASDAPVATHTYNPINTVTIDVDRVGFFNRTLNIANDLLTNSMTTPAFEYDNVTQLQAIATEIIAKCTDLMLDSSIPTDLFLDGSC